METVTVKTETCESDGSRCYECNETIKGKSVVMKYYSGEDIVGSIATQFCQSCADRLVKKANGNDAVKKNGRVIRAALFYAFFLYVCGYCINGLCLRMPAMARNRSAGCGLVIYVGHRVYMLEIIKVATRGVG